MNNLHIFINNFRKHERDGREKLQRGKDAKAKSRKSKGFLVNGFRLLVVGFRYRLTYNS